MSTTSRTVNTQADRFRIADTSAIAGLIALHEGRVDIAAAHPLQDLVAAAAKEGVKIDETRLVATPIEENRLVAITYRTNPVKQLSMEQLKGIFTGAIGIIPAGMNSPATHAPEVPLIGSPMFLITEGTPSPGVQRFIDFYLKESGFLH